MEEETKPFVKGYETNKITTFRKLKMAMLELLKGYPLYEYFGKFEHYFGENAKTVIEVLRKDEIIELSPYKKGEQVRYRLNKRGIDLAISMINLEYSEITLNYSSGMRRLTRDILYVAMLTLIIAMVQAISILFQFNVIK